MEKTIVTFGISTLKFSEMQKKKKKKKKKTKKKKKKKKKKRKTKNIKLGTKMSYLGIGFTL